MASRKSVEARRQPLSLRSVAWASASVAMVGVAALVLLVWPLPLIPIADARDRLDALRTALTIAAGAAAAATLVLAGRRQVHLEEVAVVTERDALERRITELFLKSVDQLGSEKAPVRLGGLLSLERLGQDNPPHRQSVADVICSYLRMPFNPGDLGEGPNWERAAASIIAARLAGEGSQAERQELEVRMTAQTILRRHLRISAEENERWADIDLDLNSATLVDFRFEGCRARDLRFTGATFVGVARFFQSVCDGEADFAAAKFTSNAWFWRATFHDSTWFGGATFSKEAGFAEAKFDKKPMFGGRAWFGGCTFEGVVSFQDCKLTDGVELTNAQVKLSVPQAVIDRRSWPSGWRVGNDTDSADSQWGRLAPDNE